MNWYRRNKCLDVLNAFSSSEPRDDHGRWTDSAATTTGKFASALAEQKSTHAANPKAHATTRETFLKGGSLEGNYFGVYQANGRGLSPQGTASTA